MQARKKASSLASAAFPKPAQGRAQGRAHAVTLSIASAEPTGLKLALGPCAMWPYLLMLCLPAQGALDTFTGPALL